MPAKFLPSVDSFRVSVDSQFWVDCCAVPSRTRPIDDMLDESDQREQQQARFVIHDSYAIFDVIGWRF